MCFYVLVCFPTCVYVMRLICTYRCCTGKEEDDFRPLFENFVSDLLTILNLPEWPAAEVLLTLLGMLLVCII